MKFVVAIAVVICLAKQSRAADCSQAQDCDASVNDPICAVNGAELKLFKNTCEIEKINCKISGTFVPFMKGQCPCGLIIDCYDELDPICAAEDGKQKMFRNVCYMQLENCNGAGYKLLHAGPCHCDKACTAIYEPVCAEEKGQRRTFRNECLMDKENCQGANYKIVSNGACNCSKTCAPTNKPVCVKRQTGLWNYRNRCEAEKEICEGGNLHIVNNGTCAEGCSPTCSPSAPCYHKCPSLYKPVCAKMWGKEKTFNNECDVFVANCQGNFWLISKEGECGSGNSKPCNDCPSCTGQCASKTKPTECNREEIK